MSDGLAFIDTETTGLDPDRHEIWEVAAIVDDVEHVWQLPVNLSRADPMALKINGYYDRIDRKEGIAAFAVASELRHFARRFEQLTRGRHLVGNVISFDEERLRKLLKRHGALPGWHYHLIDVESMIAGALKITPPWKSSELSEAIGVPLPVNAHTALDDARWAKAMYEAVMRQECPPGPHSHNGIGQCGTDPATW